MQVLVKNWKVSDEIKTKGMELEIRSANGEEQLGDLIITCTQVIWCKGRKTRAKGISLDWNKFIELIEKSVK